MVAVRPLSLPNGLCANTPCPARVFVLNRRFMSVSRRCTDLSTPFSTLFHPPSHLSHHRDKSERATSNAQIKRRRGSLVEYIQTGNQTGGDVFSFFFFFMNLVAEHKRVTSRRAVFIRAGRYPFRENPAAFIPRWKFSLSRASFHRVNDSRECKTKFKIFPRLVDRTFLTEQRSSRGKRSFRSFIGNR